MIFAFNANLFERGFNRSHLVLSLGDDNSCLLAALDLLLLLRQLILLLMSGLVLVLADQMLRFAVLVAHRLVLVTPIALHTALEVVVLALAADPATVREVEVLLLRVRIAAKIQRASIGFSIAFSI